MAKVPPGQPGHWGSRRGNYFDAKHDADPLRGAALSERSLPDHERGVRTRTTRWPETIIGLYKTELIRRRGPWKGIDDVEYATLEWVDWFNHRRLLEPIDNIPPAAFERPTTPPKRTAPSRASTPGSPKPLVATRS